MQKESTGNMAICQSCNEEHMKSFCHVLLDSNINEVILCDYCYGFVPKEEKVKYE